MKLTEFCQQEYIKRPYKSISKFSLRYPARLTFYEFLMNGAISSRKVFERK